MVRDSGEEKAPLYLTVLAIIMTSTALWLLIGKLVSHWLQ